MKRVSRFLAAMIVGLFFVGASAAPSQAPAVSPERMPRSCREREREERFVSSAVVATDDMKDKPSESTRAEAGLR